MILMELIEDREKFLNLIKKEWLEAPDTFPDFLSKVPLEIKAKNELYIQTITSDFQKQIKSFKRTPLGRKKWKQKTLSLINDALYNETIINLHHSMSQPTIDAFEAEIFEFLRNVRSFSPELTMNDIGQAVRNYIVFVMFKKIHNVDTGFQMPGFGYSMLYPFTDNYIDNKQCTIKDKQEYNQLIRDKIKGKAVHPSSIHHIKTCELLQAIESGYPRDIDSSIYHLLLMMLEAQELSLSQQNNEHPLTLDERLNISIYKGGISVLIDRFFVNKKMKKADLIFYLGFGFFLQLADDLQDIKEDSVQGHSTLFTTDLTPEQEEKVVNKLLNFLNRIMDNYQAENDNFKNFILNASNLLILTSSIGSKEFFSVEYLKMLEKYLPVSTPCLENFMSNKLENLDIQYQDKYMRILDELLIMN